MPRSSWTLLPGSRSPLERLYLRQNQLLLVYAHGLARLWDLEAQGMQKTMDHSGVASLLTHMDGWTEMWACCVFLQRLAAEPVFLALSLARLLSQRTLLISEL